MSQHSPQLSRRLACDACHRQKLRCKIGDTGTACERCLRTGRTCNWSPPSRNGRPPKKQQQPSPAASTGIDSTPESHTLCMAGHNTAMDTTFFDFFLDFHGGLVLPTPDEPMSTPPLQETTDPAQECMRQLSLLQEDMYKVQQTMSTGFWAEMFESPQSVIAKFAMTGISSEQCKTISYPLDKMFMAAQKLIDIIKEFLSPSSPNPRSLTERQNSEEVAQVQLDLSLALILVSCYARVLRLFNTLYLQTYNMLVALTSPGGEERLQKLCLPREIPYLRFGIFQPPQPEVLKVQLLLQVGDQMLKRIESLFSERGTSFQRKLSTILKPEMVANILASEFLKDAASGTSFPGNISIVYGNSAMAAIILSKLSDL
ncbi:hypothetical protein V1525DRAFT_61231 [Lipomyces kononenkoae]|uniref:Uncharacterized protein n=1 Tax=Lipomyces kononenkoae TaxID=34357 RepID=A0ACC3SRX2_LIPKO